MWTLRDLHDHVRQELLDRIRYLFDQEAEVSRRMALCQRLKQGEFDFFENTNLGKRPLLHRPRLP